MSSRTNLDDILVGATMGAAPTDAEVAAVVPVPGQDAAALASDIWTWVADIHALRRQGMNQASRDLAKQLGESYVAAFDTTPRPRPAGAAYANGIDPASMSPRELADAVRATSQSR
jgi:hypothetical protein